MQLDEIAVRQSLSHLEDLDLAGRVHDSRVIKFEHHARQLLDLRRPEIAILGLLLLRGPQTAGELRNRSERLYNFEDIPSVQTTLERMARPVAEADAKPRSALVTQLPRRPGEKESRYAHLLSGEPVPAAVLHEPAHEDTPADPGRLQRLESELQALRAIVDTVLARLGNLEDTDSERGQ